MGDQNSIAVIGLKAISLLPPYSHYCSTKMGRNQKAILHGKFNYQVSPWYLLEVEQFPKLFPVWPVILAPQLQQGLGD